MVKELFCNLLGIPEESIPDSHEELLAFTHLDPIGMVDKLMLAADAERVVSYYDYLFQDEPLNREECLVEAFKKFDHENGRIKTEYIQGFVTRLNDLALQKLKGGGTRRQLVVRLWH